MCSSQVHLRDLNKRFNPHKKHTYQTPLKDSLRVSVDINFSAEVKVCTPLTPTMSTSLNGFQNLLKSLSLKQDTKHKKLFQNYLSGAIGCTGTSVSQVL